MKPYTFTSKHAIAMQPLHCPLCGGGLTRSFTEDAYQCLCGEFRISGEEIISVHPGVQFKQLLRAKLMRCVEIALDMGEKSGYPLVGVKDQPKVKWDKWNWSIFESTPSDNDYFKYVADPQLKYKPIKTSVTFKTEPMYLDAYETYIKTYMKMLGVPSDFSPPAAKAEIVPKESVKLDALTPALQEFMKDYTK